MPLARSVQTVNACVCHSVGDTRWGKWVPCLLEWSRDYVSNGATVKARQSDVTSAKDTFSTSCTALTLSQRQQSAVLGGASQRLFIETYKSLGHFCSGPQVCVMVETAAYILIDLSIGELVYVLLFSQRHISFSPKPSKSASEGLQKLGGCATPQTLCGGWQLEVALQVPGGCVPSCVMEKLACDIFRVISVRYSLNQSRRG